MLRRFAPIATSASRSATQQQKRRIFFISSKSSGPSYISGTERFCLDLFAEALALYLTFEVLRLRKERKMKDVFDMLKKGGINADQLANSCLFSYENYNFFDVRLVGNYICVCIGLCFMTLVFPASFHGPSVTRMIMSAFRRK